LAPVGGSEEGDLDLEISAVPGRSVLRSLPPRAVIGANLIQGDKWYVLSASEIMAVRRLLDRKPSSPSPSVIEMHLPPLDDRLVLWGIADRKVVPLEVLDVGDSLTLLYPHNQRGKRGWYSMVGTAERECLLKLYQRIDQGKEQPVVQGKPAPACPKTSDRPNRGSNTAPVGGTDSSAIGVP
jgi:hypothetical protein